MVREIYPRPNEKPIERPPVYVSQVMFDALQKWDKEHGIENSGYAVFPSQFIEPTEEAE